MNHHPLIVFAVTRWSIGILCRITFINPADYEPLTAWEDLSCKPSNKDWTNSIDQADFEDGV